MGLLQVYAFRSGQRTGFKSKCNTGWPTPSTARFHDRMPVIVHPDHWLWWIDERRDGVSVKFMLRPYPAEDMDCYRVSKLVNNARNDSPECIKPS
jgi:putative SOS response-associated peptidase YedK